jgi:hypothetical protein
MIKYGHRIVKLQPFFFIQNEILAYNSISSVTLPSDDSHTAQEFFPCLVDLWTRWSDTLRLNRIMLAVIRFRGFIVSESASKFHFRKLG